MILVRIQMQIQILVQIQIQLQTRSKLNERMVPVGAWNEMERGNGGMVVKYTVLSNKGEIQRAMIEYLRFSSNFNSELKIMKLFTSGDIWLDEYENIKLQSEKRKWEMD